MENPTIKNRPLKLTGALYRQLRDAILDAYPTPAQLAMMVRFQFDKNIHTIAGGTDLSEVVFNLIGRAQAEGWTIPLILGARADNPGNEYLMQFAQQLQLAPTVPHGPNLERLIRDTNSFLNLPEWRTKLGHIEGQVCRIETPFSLGTGFLISADVVITNYHVMQQVIETLPKSASKVVVRFDYKRLADGTTLWEGTEFHLSNDWMIDVSPPSPIDYEPEPKSRAPRMDELDYALLRLERRAGEEPIIGAINSGASPRGWIKVGASSPLVENSPLFIVQHPQGQSLKLALDTNAIIGLNSNKTRVHYRTNTERGSSGSPCFDGNWNLVALHHSGDPNFNIGHKPQYNEGIPLTAIMELLEARGKLVTLE